MVNAPVPVHQQNSVGALVTQNIMITAVVAVAVATNNTAAVAAAVDVRIT